MKLKTSNHLFLGDQEIKHWIKSLKEKGFERMFKQISHQFGVVENSIIDPSFDFLKIVAGTIPSKATIQAGVAIDSDMNVLEIDTNQVDAITTPTDSVVRYIKIQYKIEPKEVGTVSVTVNGQLTGTGTKFTERLRGFPNFPAKISFPDSVGNTLEYEVVSVTNDTTAQLNVGVGVLVAESGLKYQVVGTFTPGTVPLLADKYPFENDGYEIAVEVTNTVTAGTQFLLASIISDGVTTTIVDLRKTSVFKLSPPQDTLVSHPFISAVVANFEPLEAGGAFNTLSVNFSYFVTMANWSFNVGTNLLTLIDGGGGIWTNTSYVDQAFNGWYVYYFTTSTKIKIVTATKVEVSPGVFEIQLVLDSYNAGYPASGSEHIYIVPPGDFMEIQVVRPTVVQKYLAPMNDGSIRVPVQAGVVNTISYRPVIGNQSLAFSLINDGSWFKEDASGFVAYTAGNITPTILPFSSAEVTNLPWTSATIIAPAVNGDSFYAPGSLVQYKQTFYKRVEFTGSIELPIGAGGWQHVFTLASGHWPVSRQYISVGGVGSTSLNASLDHSTMRVDTDGKCWLTADAFVVLHYSLDGASLSLQ